jgi:hypothetical protein
MLDTMNLNFNTKLNQPYPFCDDLPDVHRPKWAISWVGPTPTENTFERQQHEEDHSDNLQISEANSFPFQGRQKVGQPTK